MIYINSLPKNINDISNDVIVGDDYVEKAPSLYPKEAEINIKINNKKMANKREKYLKRNIHQLFSKSIEGRRFIRVIEKIIKFSKYADWCISNIKRKLKIDFCLVDIQDKKWKEVLGYLKMKYFKCLGKRKIFDKCKYIREFIYKWYRYNLDIILPWNFSLSFNSDKFGLYQQIISY